LITEHKERNQIKTDRDEPGDTNQQVDSKDMQYKINPTLHQILLHTKEGSCRVRQTVTYMIKSSCEGNHIWCQCQLFFCRPCTAGKLLYIHIAVVQLFHSSVTSGSGYGSVVMAMDFQLNNWVQLLPKPIRVIVITFTNKKLCYREQHSVSIVFRWCTL